MRKERLPSTRELARRYQRLLELAQAEKVFERGRLSKIFAHWENEAAARPSNERAQGHLSLPPSLALRFNETELRGFRVRPDIYFDQAWSETHRADPFTALDLKIRIWVPGKVSVRPSIDHPDLGAVDWRVGLRFHVDRHAPGQRTPRYHLQAGGQPQPDEWCQLYEEIAEPRLPIWPMDFALAVQMILKGLFSHIYNTVVLKDEFRGIIHHSEEGFVRPVLEWIDSYFSRSAASRAAATLAAGPTLLDFLDGRP
jgi:hypothetical protein